MSIQNFNKTYWEAKLQVSLEKTHVAASVANKSYQGTLNALDEEVTINQIGDVTINPYTRRMTLVRQEMHDASMKLKADQAYYFDFDVNDVDAVQEKPAILTATTNKAAYGFRDTVDSYLLGLYAQAGLTSYSTGTTPWNVTSLNVQDVLLDIQEKMARVPLAGRFIICPQWFHSKLELAGLTNKQDNNAIFTNGMVDRVTGFDILLSENVSAASTTTWDQTRIIAGIRGESFAYADAILKIEAFRPEAGFEDAVKGQYVFGAKILRPDMTCVAYCDKTAEA
jgi:hypothetical protein